MLEFLFMLLIAVLFINFFTNLIARIQERKWWKQLGLDFTSYSYLRIVFTKGIAITELILNSIFFFWGHLIRLQFWYLRTFK